MAKLGRKEKQAKAAKEPKAPRKKRFAQLREAYVVTKEGDPAIGLWIAGTFLVTWLLFIALGFIWGHPVYAAIVSIPIAVLAATFLFSRRAERAAYASIQGQLGAAASVLMAIKRGWTVTPAVAVAKNQDMVHRAASRAGVVLIGEGSNGVRSMLIDERKKMERFLPGTPIVEVLVGDTDDRVALRKLQKHVRKLPKQLTQVQLREVKSRLKAIGGMNIPLPKGPMPKGAKVPKVR